MAGNDKHTIYIDVDDEITAIIDKVKQSPERIVALVLPKRATVLQSIVNMKLLKKSAVSAKKSLVLITSEAGLLPLAGVVGLHVAKTLQSKPEIPPLPEERGVEANEEVVSVDAEPEPVVNPKQPAAADETETIELDNTVDNDSPVTKTKSALAKRFKVPDFDKFRIGFFLAILAVILLITGWVFAYIVMPKAKITIKTDSTTIPSNISFTANTAATALDEAGRIVPAVSKEVKKTDSEKTTATGKKDMGTKASGTLSLKNCEDSNTRTVPAGTVFSTSGKSYVTTEAVTVRAGSFSGGGTVCNTGSDTVGLVAQSAGDSYNIAASTYSTSFSGLSGNFKMNGSAMTGGTSKVVTVVSQEDVDTAVAKMKGRKDTEAEAELASLIVADGLLALSETKVISEPKATSTPAVGAEASGEITVTAETTYTVLGVKQSDLSLLIKKDVEGKIDKDKQSILDDGLGDGVMRLENRKSPTEALINMQTLVIAGPQLDENALKEAARGKKRGDVEKSIGSLPGVKEVTVQYSPFWIYRTPKATKKITVIIEKPVTVETTKTTDDTNQ